MTIHVLMGLITAGFFVGAVGTFFGVGGGIIVIPLLTTVFGYPIHEAVATSLIIVLSTSIFTTTKNLANGYTNIELGLIIASFSLVGSIFGGTISGMVAGYILYFVLGSVQIMSAIIMLGKDKLPKSAKSRVFKTYSYLEKGQSVPYNVYHIQIACAIALLNGVFSGMVGVGGGVVIIPVMTIMMGVPMKVATATSAFIMGFTASGAGALMFLNGLARVDAVAVLVPAIFLSSRICHKFFVKTNNESLQKAFIVLLVLVAMQMFYKGFSGF